MVSKLALTFKSITFACVLFGDIHVLSPFVVLIVSFRAGVARKEMLVEVF